MIRKLTKFPHPERGMPSVSPGLPDATRRYPARLAFRSFLRVAGLIRRVMDPYFAQLGVSGAQWSILWTLYGLERRGVAGVRAKDLSEHMLIRPPSVTTLLDRLERQELVVRTGDRGDQRCRVVSLTRRGRSLITRSSRSHGRRIDRLLGGLSAAGQLRLHRLLERAARGMEQMAEETGPSRGASKDSSCD
jgi:DNA-binding MarR family transcriptional regulator